MNAPKSAVEDTTVKFDVMMVSQQYKPSVKLVTSTSGKNVEYNLTGNTVTDAGANIYSYEFVMPSEGHRK